MIHAIAYTVLAAKKQESTLREIVARAEEYAKQSYVSPADPFEKEAESHSPGFIFMRRSFVFDKLRSDPRFVDLGRRCDLLSED